MHECGGDVHPGHDQEPRLVKMLDGWNQNLNLLCQFIGSPPIAPLPYQESIDQRSSFRAEYRF